MNIQKAYEAMQKECGIEVGDKVKVLREACDDEMGWDNAWLPEMSDAVGKIYVVADAHTYCGIVIRLGKYDTRYRFPFFVLELVEKFKKEEEEIMEVTVQDVEDKFGCRVKIIKEED